MKIPFDYLIFNQITNQPNEHCLDRNHVQDFVTDTLWASLGLKLKVIRSNTTSPRPSPLPRLLSADREKHFIVLRDFKAIGLSSRFDPETWHLKKSHSQAIS